MQEKQQKEFFDKNVLSYFAFCAIAIFILIESSHMNPNSAMFPRLLSMVMLGLNLFLIAQYFFHFFHKRARKETIYYKKIHWGNLSNFKKYDIHPLFVFILCFLFIIAYNRIGFELSAIFLAASIMLSINKKEAIKKLYFAILIPLFFLLIFKVGLHLRIPLLMEKYFQ